LFDVRFYSGGGSGGGEQQRQELVKSELAVSRKQKVASGAKK
jgi:hypothetical protein